MDTLEPKLRQKLMEQLQLMSQPPLPKEPHVKHFSIAKYSELYELHARSKIMVRIVFTVQDGDCIVLLTPFIKKHKRNTMQALDTSLKLQAQINSGTCPVKELAVNFQE